MTFEAMRLLTRTIRGTFLLSVIFAVLWTKGYLWWVFGIAVFLYLVLGLTGLNPPSYLQDIDDDDEDFDDDDDEEDEESGDEVPPVSPPRPHYPRR